MIVAANTILVVASVATGVVTLVLLGLPVLAVIFAAGAGDPVADVERFVGSGKKRRALWASAELRPETAPAAENRPRLEPQGMPVRGVTPAFRSE
ncbi:MAG TPA: hypothetical protein VFA66_12750 [Gaiellaceae bacterium]|nr:hypothetical protein [Gaiellaceae bacterium]